MGAPMPATSSMFPPHARGWTSREPEVGCGRTVSPARAGMDPRTATAPSGTPRFPRTRGDGPSRTAAAAASFSFPPHGAGMDPAATATRSVLARFPRTRGDGPRVGSDAVSHVMFPPHARGWTHRPRDGSPADLVSPARAGMDPPAPRRRGRRCRFPRTRGDGPVTPMPKLQESSFPPHARGWTLHAHLGRRLVDVSPARAGMDPAGIPSRAYAGGFPRTRGDGPAPARRKNEPMWFPPHARGWTLRRAADRYRTGVSPARAGMDRGRTDRVWGATGFPRTRGDGPFIDPRHPQYGEFPPHARGWTRLARGASPPATVSPARAGMDRSAASSGGGAACFPRTRGDGPIRSMRSLTTHPFPPHARGWTGDADPDRRGVIVSPARAGMDRFLALPRRRRRRFPRTRGDGPRRRPLPHGFERFPPHARGWTLWVQRLAAVRLVSPARAGMDLGVRRLGADANRFPRTRGDGPRIEM